MPIDLTVPATEIELAEVIDHTDGAIRTTLRKLAFERDRLRAAIATAQAERDAAHETVKSVMVRVVPAISQAAIVGKTYDHFVVVGMVETLVADLRKAEAERDEARDRVRLVRHERDAALAGERECVKALRLAERERDAARQEAAAAQAQLNAEMAENLSLRSQLVTANVACDDAQRLAGFKKGRIVDGQPGILEDADQVRQARDEWIAKHAACVEELTKAESDLARLQQELKDAEQARCANFDAISAERDALQQEREGLIAIIRECLDGIEYFDTRLFARMKAILKDESTPLTETQEPTR